MVDLHLLKDESGLVASLISLSRLSISKIADSYCVVAAFEFASLGKIIGCLGKL